MSIAVGVRCQDGIVLAADREMSAGDFKYYEGKISGIQLANGSFLMAQAARDVDDMPRLYERVAERIKDSTKSVEEIRREVESALSSLREWKPDCIEHQALIALSISPNAPLLWKSGNAKITPVLVPWSMIGFGESSLTHYLFKVLFKSGMELRIAQATIYSIYIINQAKQHITGCGSRGPTDVVCLKPDGLVVPVPTLNIDAIERHWELIEFQSSVALGRITDRRLQLAYIRNGLKEFAEFLEGMHMNFKLLEL